MDLSSLMKYSYTDDDLRACVGQHLKILTYPELENLELDSLFGPGGYSSLLFLTESKTSGHWIAVLRHGVGQQQKIEVFDSFGTPVDGDRVWLDHRKLASLHETLPLLGDVLKAAEQQRIPVEHNTHKLQKDTLDTCGRHVCARLMNADKSLADYLAFLKQCGGTPDEAVTRITFSKIGK